MKLWSFGLIGLLFVLTFQNCGNHDLITTSLDSYGNRSGNSGTTANGDNSNSGNNGNTGTGPLPGNGTGGGGSSSSGGDSGQSSNDTPAANNPLSSQGGSQDPNRWKHFFGVGWNGRVEDQLAFANQMGYRDIALLYGTTNRTLYANSNGRANMRYYILDPEILQDMIPVVGQRRVRNDGSRSYSPEQIAFYEKYMVWRNNDPFPKNIQTGWHFSVNDFRTNWDFQQQEVIDFVIDEFVKIVKSYENKAIGFTFGGYMVDVPRLSGEFHLWNYSTGQNEFNYLSDLTPNHTDSSLLHGSITHQLPNYVEGKAAFYKQLNARLGREFPGFKRILEPYRIYQPNSKDEWLWQISQRADKNLLIPDFLSQEGSGTQFVDDLASFQAIAPQITASTVGTSEPNELGEYENRLYAAKAAINGSWFNWFGRFGGTGSMPRFLNITEVYPRLQLIRCIPNWDNLRKIPLGDRHWNGTTYSSPNSFVSSEIIYSRHPDRNEIFVVFLNRNGRIVLKTGEQVIKVQRVDSRFVGLNEGGTDLQIVNSEIRVKPEVSIDLTRGSGYIVFLNP